MRLNRSLINDLQSLTFEEKLVDSITNIDFNYLGFDKNLKNSKLLKVGPDSNTNRVLFWLCSKKTDYVREPNKGGVLYAALGKNQGEINVTELESSLKEQFNYEFSNDLQLIMLKIVPDNSFRKLIINMIILDKLINKTFTVSTEAAI